MEVTLYLDVNQTMTAGDIQSLVADGTIPADAILVSDTRVRFQWIKTTVV